MRARATSADRSPRQSRRARDLATWERSTQMATLLSIGAACMMATAVEIYHADSLPPGTPMLRYMHRQAFVAGCAGFLPAFLFLQRLNAGSWSKAVRFTAPWLILLLDTVITVIGRLPWFWAIAISLPLGAVAYRAMVRIARQSANV